MPERILFEDNGIKYGFWALQRPLTKRWGSGQVFEILSMTFGKPDVAFGKTDNIPTGILAVDKEINFNWLNLPYEDNQFGFGYWDPPYDRLYKNEGKEIWRTCRKLAILHTHIFPRAWLKEAKRIGMVGITMGPMKQIRCLQIFEKTEANNER